MDKYLQNNKALWNEITPIHVRSGSIDLSSIYFFYIELYNGQMRLLIYYKVRIINAMVF